MPNITLGSWSKSNTNLAHGNANKTGFDLSGCSGTHWIAAGN